MDETTPRPTGEPGLLPKGPLPPAGGTSQHGPVPPPAHPSSPGIHAADGSSITVSRNTAGQVTEASGTGADGVTRKVTITITPPAPSGTNLVAHTQATFFANGQEFLSFGSALAPGTTTIDAAAGTVHFGYTISLQPGQNTGGVVTTSGVRGTVHIVGNPPTAASASIDLSFPQPIMDAFKSAEYFAPVFAAGLLPAQAALAPTHSSGGVRLDASGPPWWKLLTVAGGAVGSKLVCATPIPTISLACLGGTALIAVAGYLIATMPDNSEGMPEPPPPPADSGIPDGTPSSGGVGGTSGDDGDGGGDGDGGDGDGDGGCFIAGTPVHTAARTCPIEQLRVGDVIRVFNLRKQAPDTRAVTAVLRSESEEIVALDFGDEVIRCTPPHRFHAVDWTAARTLTPGVMVSSLDARGRVLRQVSRQRTSQPVFNLSVDGVHNFFVGASGMLVHNVKKQPGSDDTPVDDGGSGPDALKATAGQLKPPTRK